MAAAGGTSGGGGGGNSAILELAMAAINAEVTANTTNTTADILALRIEHGT